MSAKVKLIGLPILVAITFLAFPVAPASKTQASAQVIHNEKEGAWGKTPAVRLELVRTSGGLEVKDPNLAFGSPYDVVVDSKGNIYVLDNRNDRIQVLAPDGTYLRTIGRRGQGPGDLQGAFSMAIDSADRLFVFDNGNSRIQALSAEGKAETTIKLRSVSMDQIRLLKSGGIVMGGLFNLRTLMGVSRKLPKLLTVIDLKGKTLRTFGEMRNYRDALVNSMANWICLDVDGEDNVCVTFRYQNRIDKYSADGALAWTADRILNYGTDVIDKGFIRHTPEGGIMIQGPTLNTVSSGIAADGMGRIWVITLNRQMTREEQGEEVTGGAVRKIVEPVIKKMDIYKLEVFGPDGILLGSIPLNVAAHGIRICGVFLFLWERNKATVYQYLIQEN